MKRLLPILLLLLTALPALAQISPGKLSRFHASLEGISSCTRCHELGQEVSSAKCLDCHTQVRARQSAGTGYHSSGEAKDRPCRTCHSEHNGRDFELIHWPAGRSGFDHALTGFTLEGAHRGKDCGRCHTAALLADPQVKSGANSNPARTLLGLSRECVACHDDEHGAQLDDNCQGCHSLDAWTPATGFSHARTDFPLTGKHQVTACVKCHPFEAAGEASGNRIGKANANGQTARYSGLDYANCAPCHRDVHAGKFGQGCTDCHTTAGFQQIVGNKFDHAVTDYPLTGRHQRVACAKCHTSGDMTRKVAHAACRDCHKDEHGGQLAKRADGGACESCHTTDGYRPVRYGADEHAASRYPLTGSHLAVPCNGCHTPPPGQTGPRFAYAETRCQSCHRDAHNGQLDLWVSKNGCEFCHSTETWHRTSFDHKLARFPLEGKHREILCLKCHTVRNDSTGQEAVWMKPLDMECAGCHEDRHDGQFVRAERQESRTDCRRCHSPAGWKTLTFDHNRDARFKLEGAHSRVACAACHKPNPDDATHVVYKPLPVDCAGCHSGGTSRL
jgi:hypothetical protein